MIKYLQPALNNRTIFNKKVFLLIGGQSNTGTNGHAVNDQYPMGRVAYSLLPKYLRGEQINQKIWNGAGWDNFEQPNTDQYGWINHLLNRLNLVGCQPYIYKWGQGGTQLTAGSSPFPSYNRNILKDYGLPAWNQFKTENPDGVMLFLWNQGFTDALDLTNTNNYDTTLANWFAEVRSHFSLPTLKIMFNSLSNNATAATYRATLKTKQQTVAALSDNNIIIDADGMDYQSDESHFSEIGVQELGDAFFEKVNRIF